MARAYVVRNEELKDLNNAFSEKANTIATRMEGMKKDFNAIIQTKAFDGKTAKNVKNYFSTVYPSLLDMYTAAASAISNGFAVYMAKYVKINGDDAHGVMNSGYMDDLKRKNEKYLADLNQIMQDFQFEVHQHYANPYPGANVSTLTADVGVSLVYHNTYFENGLCGRLNESKSFLEKTIADIEENETESSHSVLGEIDNMLDQIRTLVSGRMSQDPNSFTQQEVNTYIRQVNSSGVVDSYRKIYNYSSGNAELIKLGHESSAAMEQQLYDERKAEAEKWGFITDIAGAVLTGVATVCLGPVGTVVACAVIKGVQEGIHKGLDIYVEKGSVCWGDVGDIAKSFGIGALKGGISAAIGLGATGATNAIAESGMKAGVKVLAKAGVKFAQKEAEGLLDMGEKALKGEDVDWGEFGKQSIKNLGDACFGMVTEIPALSEMKGAKKVLWNAGASFVQKEGNTVVQAAVDNWGDREGFLEDLAKGSLENVSSTAFETIGSGVDELHLKGGKKILANTLVGGMTSAGQGVADTYINNAFAEDPSEIKDPWDMKQVGSNAMKGSVKELTETLTDDESRYGRWQNSHEGSGAGKVVASFLVEGGKTFVNGNVMDATTVLITEGTGDEARAKAWESLTDKEGIYNSVSNGTKAAGQSYVDHFQADSTETTTTTVTTETKESEATFVLGNEDGNPDSVITKTTTTETTREAKTSEYYKGDKKISSTSSTTSAPDPQKVDTAVDSHQEKENYISGSKTTTDSTYTSIKNGVMHEEAHKEEETKFKNEEREKTFKKDNTYYRDNKTTTDVHMAGTSDDEIAVSSEKTESKDEYTYDAKKDEYGHSTVESTKRTDSIQDAKGNSDSSVVSESTTTNRTGKEDGTVKTHSETSYSRYDEHTRGETKLGETKTYKDNEFSYKNTEDTSQMYRTQDYELRDKGDTNSAKQKTFKVGDYYSEETTQRTEYTGDTKYDYTKTKTTVTSETKVKYDDKQKVSQINAGQNVLEFYKVDEYEAPAAAPGMKKPDEVSFMNMKAGS